MIEDAATSLPNLLEFGVGGAALGVVMAYVVRPLLSSALKQNERALDLLAKSVDSNTEAVDLLRAHVTQAQTSNTQILMHLTELRQDLARQRTLP